MLQSTVGSSFKAPGTAGSVSSCYFHLRLSPLLLRRRCLQSARRPRTSNNRSTTTAALDQGVYLSVLQQGVAFVIVSLGEGIYTRSQLKQNAKGRPAMLTLITTTLALAAALGLLAQGQQKTGLAMGTVVSAALLLLDIKRAYDVEDAPREWPGPRAWPATLALISFFALNVFGQALLRA